MRSIRAYSIVAATAAVLLIHSGRAAQAPQVDFNPKVDLDRLPKECQNFIRTTLPQHHWTGGFVGVPEDWH